MTPRGEIARLVGAGMDEVPERETAIHPVNTERKFVIACELESRRREAPRPPGVKWSAAKRSLRHRLGP